MLQQLLVTLILAFHAHASTMDEERSLARPWFTKNVHPMFPFTPVTMVCALVAICYLYFFFFDKTSAEASHILLSKGEHPEKVLKDMKKEINNDPVKFAAMAKRFSECPSGAGAGGNLGTFTLGAMAPPFEKAVFDPKTSPGTVIGPIETQFGWHLILVHKRQLS
jgi:parvulin-like peptidyl-prolyl isomerase